MFDLQAELKKVQESLDKTVYQQWGHNEVGTKTVIHFSSKDQEALENHVDGYRDHIDSMRSPQCSQPTLDSEGFWNITFHYYGLD